MHAWRSNARQDYITTPPRWQVMPARQVLKSTSFTWKQRRLPGRRASHWP